MNKPLSFFNWSLSNTLDTIPDSFIKARVRILYTILLFSILKTLIVLGTGTVHEQWLQVIRAAIALLIYIALTKTLLYKPSLLTQLAHIMIFAGVVIVWTNIYVYAHKVNLITLQFVFMIILSSFYTLGSRLGFIYSVSGTLPVVLFLLSNGNVDMYIANSPQELASPGYEIIVILNFLSITIAHYLFFKAFNVNLDEKEKLNGQLQLSIAEANKLAASKSNFLSTMSHELRTPLNSVVGITELLLQDSHEEKQKENLKILQFSTLDLLSLINNVLDFNKTDSDNVVLEAVPFRLAEFIRHRCAGLKIKAIDKNLNFIVDIDKQLEETIIISDPTRLSQLIYNLVSNAIKFTDNGSITIKLDCVHKTENGVEVLFAVTDTGIGIQPDRHETIFNLFTQAESDITRKYGGTGLGLAIVKQVLALFNSKIQLDSTPGKGSKFYFTLPFITTTEETIPGAKVAPLSETTDLGHLKILIAEDNELNRLLMQKQLDKFNIKPVLVENGEQAYQACLSGHYDAVFMDLHMPILDGYKATNKIRSLSDPEIANVYIIAFTASVTEQEKIFENGFNDFLYKPVNMNDLRDKLEKINLNKQGLPDK